MARRARRSELKSTSGSEALADPSQALGMSMLRAREIVVAPVRQVLRLHDLSEQQWRILRVLCGEPSLNATTLAQRTVLLLPSLSRILIDLEQRGLVQKLAPAGSRRPNISITAKGRGLVAAVFPKVHRAQQPIRDRVGPTNIAMLLKLLHRFSQ